MVYEVVVVDPPDGGRFEHEFSEPPKKGEHFFRADVQPLMSYKVLRVLHGNDQFDGVVEAEHVGGQGVNLGRT